MQPPLTLMNCWTIYTFKVGIGGHKRGGLKGHSQQLSGSCCPPQPCRYTGALCDIIKGPTSELPPLPRCVHAASESDSLCASLRIRPAMRGPFLTCRLTAGKCHVCFLQACLPRSTDGAVTALLSFSRCSFSGVGWGGCIARAAASESTPRGRRGSSAGCE